MNSLASVRHAVQSDAYCQAMTRIQAPELEDYPWFPAPLRDALTDMLHVMATTLHVFDAAIPLLCDVLAETEAERIVDLCSGGGGPLLSLAASLEQRRGRRVPIILTDRFPNTAAFARAEAERPGQAMGRREPTDATAVPEELTGLRTIFNALHHFPPPLARSIFADAVRKRQPIASFEIVERTASGALMLAALPTLMMALTPLATPRTFARFALTYALPVVPAVIVWDGFASCLRAYSPRELRALVEGLGDDGYSFRVERRRVPHLPVYLTSLIGIPSARRGRAS